jgi:tRNA A37 methylthiotransferase MiaB
MAVPRILLVIPPLTQLNTPYPSTAYLSGFLQSRGIASEQADLGIEMVLRLFSRDGLRRLFSLIRSQRRDLPMEARRMLANKQAYLDTIGTVVSFLQGKHPSAATHLIRAGILPQGPRFRGRAKFPRGMLLEDQAKQWATFYLEDLADLVQATVAPHFSLSRYAEQIAHATSSFDGIAAALAEPPTFTDELLLGALWGHIDRVKPTLVGLSVPFPGNLYGAFRIAQGIKQHRPDISIVLGGGYANTELRRIADLRVFDYVDFITLDDGERPLLSLIEHLDGRRPRQSLCRTFYRKNSRVCFTDDTSIADFSMDEIGCPTYRGLDLDRYLTILDSTNPMHRLWSEGHWNKLTVAHGCYWKQCTFCDVGLNYISRYEMTPIQRLIGQIEQLIVETGRRGFHFVDEAAPPAGLKALALALLERDIAMTWWGNIRFEAAFTPDLCRLLAASGCIAVTAGLETASDRLLEKMKKGITVDQTALVAKAFNDAGILVHAYLMYGFPSETVQDTIDALERVRQLIAAGLIQSGFWHRFTTTAHSPIGLNPASHGLRILGPEFQGFAENDLLHRGRGGAVPEWLGKGLRRSMLNFIEQRGLNMDVREWFDHAAPKPRISPTWVQRLLKSPLAVDEVRAERRLVWLGGVPVCEPSGKATRLVLSRNSIARTVVFADRQALWLTDLIKRSTPRNKPELYPRVQEVRATFPEGQAEFERFLESRTWKEVRSAGLLLI